MNTQIQSILLIDDDHDDRFFFHTALQHVTEDVQLFTASNGVDALDKLKFITPDVILLDLIMPRMNGVVFLKMLKRMPRLKEIPVIIYTTDLSIFQESELLELGAIQILLKPNDLRSTEATIKHILATNSYQASA
jgi:CheY-like chemotaxis protein